MADKSSLNVSVIGGETIADSPKNASGRNSLKHSLSRNMVLNFASNT